MRDSASAVVLLCPISASGGRQCPQQATMQKERVNNFVFVSILDFCLKAFGKKKR